MSFLKIVMPFSKEVKLIDIIFSILVKIMLAMRVELDVDTLLKRKQNFIQIEEQTLQDVFTEDLQKSEFNSPIPTQQLT